MKTKQTTIGAVAMMQHDPSPSLCVVELITYLRVRVITSAEPIYEEAQ